MPTQSKTLTPEAIEIIDKQFPLAVNIRHEIHDAFKGEIDEIDDNADANSAAKWALADTELLRAAGLHTTEELNQARKEAAEHAYRSGWNDRGLQRRRRSSNQDDALREYFEDNYLSSEPMIPVSKVMEILYGTGSHQERIFDLKQILPLPTHDTKQ